MLIKEKEAKIFVTRLAGVSYEGRQHYIEGLTTETPLFIRREPNNVYDPHAIAVYACFSKEEQKIGYIPRTIAKEIAKKVEEGAYVLVQFLEKKVESYNGMDYEKGELRSWEFTGVVIGIMC